MNDFSLLNEHIANLSLQQTVFRDSTEFQKSLYQLIDRACRKISSSSKKISKLDDISKIYEIIQSIKDKDEQKILQNFIHKTLEDDISIRIVQIIGEHENFIATHDQYNNGHVDIVVESKDFHYKWLGEAKLYGGKKYSKQGLEQLIHDYSKGLQNESGGVILPFLMDRISRIKCSSMAAYHRWLDEAFHDYRTTTNGWHNPEYHLSC